MSSNDSTRPEDDGRTVATDADRAEPSSSPGPDAATEDATGEQAGGEAAAARPSPVPRSSSPDTRWESQGEGESSGTGAANGTAPSASAPPSSPSSSTTAASADSPTTAEPAAEPAPETSAAAGGSAQQAEGPPPWRRVPGDQPAAQEEQERPTVADSLLSEAPTAFLSGPRGGSAEAEPVAAGTATATATAEPTGGDTNGRAAAPGVRPAPTRNRPPRQALLQLKRLDPWSVLKMALALAVVLFLVWMVAAGVLYGVLGGMGVWDRLNGTYADLVTGQAQDSGSLISAGRVFLLAAVVGAINSLLFAVALTIGAFVYNVAADLVGGIEVTLSERD